MSHRATRIIGIIGCVSLAACTGAPNTEDATQETAAAAEKASAPVTITQQEAEEMSNNFVAALRAGDGAAATNAYAPDAILISARGKVEGRDAITAFWSDAVKSGAGKELALQTIKFTASGDMAYTLSHFTGGITAPTGHVLAVSQRQPDGTVKMVAQVSIPEAKK